MNKSENSNSKLPAGAPRSEERPTFYTDKHMELIGNTRVYFDEGTDTTMEEYAEAKRPYYRLRGERVTEEQAFEIIRCTDGIFYNEIFDKWHNGGYDDCIGEFCFTMRWFDEFFCPHGWVHPNGIVGANYHIGMKYPAIDEYIWGLAETVEKFPFLNFVAGITTWDEICDKRWEMHFNHDGAYKEARLTDMEREGFEDVLEMGIWVHDGIIEIMNPERTAEMYRKYEQLYEEEDKRIYMIDYYRLCQPDVLNLEYFYRCLSAYGIKDPEKFIQERIDEGGYNGRVIKGAVENLLRAQNS